MQEYIRDMLAKGYGLKAISIEEVPAGWSAGAYAVRCDAGGFFVKLYDKSRVSTLPWIRRIDTYMPCVLWLYANTSLRDCMTAPILAKNGACKMEDERHVLMVFPLIEGETINEKRLNQGQVCDLASTLARLHSYGSEVPVETTALDEAYAVPFAENLAGLLSNEGLSKDLADILLPHKNSLCKGLDSLQILLDRLHASSPQKVLCHSDVHGWNLMWAGRLILIDWEGLRLAPPEADLFSFTDGFFFDYAQDAFFAQYKKLRDYKIDETAMAFYRLRRRLEDIWEFANSLINDALTKEEADRSLWHLENECRALCRMKELLPLDPDMV